jgi:hypothetical protein
MHLRSFMSTFPYIRYFLVSSLSIHNSLTPIFVRCSSYIPAQAWKYLASCVLCPESALNFGLVEFPFSSHFVPLQRGPSDVLIMSFI